MAARFRTGQASRGVPLNGPVTCELLDVLRPALKDNVLMNLRRLICGGRRPQNIQLACGHTADTGRMAGGRVHHAAPAWRRHHMNVSPLNTLTRYHGDITSVGYLSVQPVLLSPCPVHIQYQTADMNS